MIRPLLVAVLLLVPRLLAAQNPDQVIDLRAARAAPTHDGFEALWSTLRKAEQGGDTEAQESALHDIRRLRVERNIRSLEPIALARVGQGLERLERGERDRAEECFRVAVGLDPYLPDAYFALALTALKSGPMGIVSAVRHTVEGMGARLPTVGGRSNLVSLLIPVAVVSLLALSVVVAVALLIRHGGLLVHDFEETLGPGRGRAPALAVCALLLVLPAATFQGWAWLPFWMLGLLFIYLDRREKVLVGALLVCGLAVGPAVKYLEARVLAHQNPLFAAAVLSLEGGPDARAAMRLEDAVRQAPDDRDLLYMLATQYRKAGRYGDATALYRDVLRSEPQDTFALNNLANLEFAGGEFQAAIARYKQGIEAAPAPEVGATLYYNLSLAHLQRFEYQPAQEARSQAERLASGLVRAYDSTWKYDKGDYAVVDLRLAADEIWAKFMGTPSGVRAKNMAGRSGAGGLGLDLARATLNRFSASLLVMGAVAFALWRWRGPRMFTRRCVKCGTPFCKRCQLGTASGALCTQCHHLFVVRDGVSGPARNQKLLEVQEEDERRDRIFRLLSLSAPGAGHVYARRTLVGAAFIALWSVLLALILLAGRLLPLTEASAAVTLPWGLGLGWAALLAVYVAANRSRPEFEVVMPAGRRPAGRGYAA